jgi:hypothetical protein
MSTNPLCESRAQLKEDSSCPRPRVSWKKSSSLPVCLGKVTTFISKEVADTNSYVAAKNPKVAQSRSMPLWPNVDHEQL